MAMALTKANRVNWMTGAAVAAAMSFAMGGGTAFSAEAPSNAELYKMLLDLQKENAALKGELKKLTAINDKEIKQVKAKVAKQEAVIQAQETSIAQSAALANRVAYSPPAADGAPAHDYPTVELGFEVPFLTLNANHASGDSATGGNAWFNDEPDPDTSYRVIGSLISPDGLGLRGRYFHFDAEDSEGNDHFSTSLYDGELTARLDLEKWSFLGFGGVRGGHVRWSDEDENNGYKFHGVGVTAGLEARRHLGNGLALLGAARHSLMFGSIDELNTDDSVDNVSVPVTDLRVGIEWQKRLSNNMIVNLGAGYEATLFSSLSGNIDSDIDPEDIDVTLAGPYVALKVGF
jgi:hypothetical protein